MPAAQSPTSAIMVPATTAFHISRSVGLEAARIQITNWRRGRKARWLGYTNAIWNKLGKYAWDRITAALDFLDQRTLFGLPIEFRARALGAHAAIGAHCIVSRSVAPFDRRLLHGHALRTPALPEHATDRFTHLAHGIFTVLGVIERAGWCLFDCQHVQCYQVVDVYVSPAVLARADVLRHAELLRHLNQPRHLDAVRIEAVPKPVDQARRNHDRAHTVARRTPHHLVDLDAGRPLRRGHERRVLIEHLLDQLAAGAGADDAGAVSVQEGFAGVGERLEHGFGRSAMAGTGGVDRNVGVIRGPSQNFGVIEGAVHRRHPELG